MSEVETATMITDDEYEAACHAGDAEQEVYGAVSVRYEERGDVIMVKLARGIELSVPRLLLQGLGSASLTDLHSIELSPSGLGLRIPNLDWDMSIRGIMHGRYGSPRWMMGLAGEETRVVRSGPARH